MKVFSKYMGCLLGILQIIHALPGPFVQYSHTRIVGGEEAKPHQFPYQVGLNLYLKNGGVSFCGGSLISAWYILTAAHCTDNVGRMEVIMGAHNVNNEKEVTQIRMNTSIIIPHEKWYPTVLLNDIALVKLPKKISFNKYISPVQLPEGDLSDYAKKDAIVSGWGKTSDDSNSMSNVLRFVDSDVISLKDCQDHYPKVIHESHLCISAKNGKSSCNGDSGGPLVIENKGSPLQIGIVSFGHKTCETNHPAVFTRITKYLKWIKENIQK